MHNCKTTRSSLIDLALDETKASARSGAQSSERARLLAELAACSDCRTEYAALRRSLSIVDQATEAAVPAESFWPGYNSRLTQRLRNAAAADSLALVFQPRTSGRVWSALRHIAAASVRIPTPVAAVLLLSFGLSMGLSMFLALQARGQVKQTPQRVAAVVETRTIEVPVIKERIVTRVVYVAKNRRPGPAQAEPNAQSIATVAARFPREPANAAAGNLSGFRPTDQVKLTIIKGSYHDEK